MGTPGCDACCNVKATAQSVESSRWAVISLLCEILTAVSGGGGATGNVNISSINGSVPSMDNGNSNSGTLRVTIAADSDGQVVLAEGTDRIGKVALDLTTPGTTNLVAAGLVAGTAIAGKFGIDQTTDGTTNAVHLVAGTALAGKFGIDQTTLGATNGVSSVAATTGGYTTTRVSGGLSTTVTAIKSSAQGKLGGWVLFNPNSTNVFVQIFNVATAGAVTLGTTAPNLSIGLAPFGGANLLNDTGIDFSAGIQVACTTTEAGSTAPTTNITANFQFK